MLTLKRFDKWNWQAWAGATPFSDGDPYIAEFQLSDVGQDGLPRDAVLVIGSEGAEVIWCESDGGDTWSVRHAYDGQWSSVDARKLASRLIYIMSLHELFLLGFSTEIQEL